MRIIRFSIVCVLSIFAASAFAGKTDPKNSWTDSYSKGGKCYCYSTYDHGIGSKKVTIKGKKYSVKEACKIVGKGPGIGKNPRYNTVQCGHGPAHGEKIKGTNFADELKCPGRVDMGKKGCNKKGPKWDTSKFSNASSAKKKTTKKTTRNRSSRERKPRRG